MQQNNPSIKLLFMTSGAIVNKIPTLAILLLMVLCCPVKAFSQTVIYVDQRATGSKDGTSWESAFINLHEALALAKSADEIWVAAGVYKPDQGPGMTLGDRTARFELAGGAKLYGGFRGDESNLESRQLGFDTVLSGDLEENDPEGMIPSPLSDVYSDNSQVILRLNSGTQMMKTIADGVIVKGGAVLALSASGPCSLNNISVLESVGPNAASVLHCIVDGLVLRNNNVTGRGALQTRSTSYVNSIFEGNVAKQGGAIQALGEDSLFVSKSVFSYNLSNDGGAIIGSGPPLVVVSSIFLNNVAECAGGAVFIDRGSLTSVNNVFASNRSNNRSSACGPIAEGGAIMIYKGRYEDYNSTFLNNNAVGMGDVVALLDSQGTMSNSIWHQNTSGNEDINLDLSSLTVNHIQIDEPLNFSVQIEGPVVYSSTIFSDLPGEDGIEGTGDDNYQLSPASKGIDTGSKDLVPRDFADLDGDNNRSEPTPVDGLGEPRVIGTDVDLGAFEFPIPTGIEVPVKHNSCFEAFPNPFGESLNISVQQSGVKLIQVFDATGRKVTDVEVGPKFRASLVSKAWPAGVYLLRSPQLPKCSEVLIHF